MTSKHGRFDMDWWVVQKRLIYIIIAALIFALLAVGVGVYVWKYGNPFASTKTTTDVPEGARFASFEGDVRVIRATTRETIPASSKTQLYPGDTVQTQADGRARITLADGSSLVIRPNSTVTIRDNTSSESGQKNVRVKVDTGQINVRTEQQPEGTNNVVETSQSQSKLASETASSFNVNPDKTAEIRVQTGQIETTTNSGEKTVIRSNEFVSVNPAGTLAQREHLLDSPVPSGPRNLERISTGRNGAASVTLRWVRPQSGMAAHYRVEVASSPFFVAAGKVIERDQLASSEFNASDLRPGDYFWRVRATARSGQDSDWSEPLKFTITSQGTGDRLSFAEVTAEYVGGQIYVIRGRTQRGTTVSFMGRETLADSNGSFRLQITAPEGAGDVTIEAQDQQGNRSPHRVQLSGGATKQRK
jgi:FecR protein